jgi:hypothetical protein
MALVAFLIKYQRDDDNVQINTSTACMGNKKKELIVNHYSYFCTWINLLKIMCFECVNFFKTINILFYQYVHVLM